MATREESNDSNTYIEDCGDVRQIGATVTSTSSSVVPLRVPMFTLSSSTTSTVSSCSTARANNSSQPTTTPTALTTAQISHKQHVPSLFMKSSTQTKISDPLSSIQSGSLTKTTAASESFTHKKSSLFSTNEPLNLSVNSKPDEKQITSSLFGVIQDPVNVTPVEDRVTGNLSSAVQASSSYKRSHPIGSRKVTENVITYHEPMFQSVANNLFENQKNSMMGKRKADDERNKEESSLPDSKKRKLEPLCGVSPSKSPVSSPIKNVKKKCSIENIIERIRTEKTVSRGGVSASTSATNGKPTEVECGSSEIIKQESVSSDTEKVSSTTNSKDVTKPIVSSNSSDSVVVSSTSNSPDSHKVTSTTHTPELESDSCLGNHRVNTDTSVVSESTKTSDNKSVRKNSKDLSAKSIDNSTKTTPTTSIKKKSDNDSLKGTNEKVSKQKQKNDKTENKSVKSSEQKNVKSKSQNDISQSDNNESADAKKSKKKELFPVKTKNTKADEKTKKTSDSDTVKKGTKKAMVATGKDMKGKSNTEKDETVDDKKKKVKKKKVSEEIDDDDFDDYEEESSDGQKKSKNESKKSVNLKKRKIETPAKKTKPRKPKLAIACRRVKREASLNATMFLNILNESPRLNKLESQRSKSDSDLKNVQSCSIRAGQSSHSMSNLTTNIDNIDKLKFDTILDGQKLQLKLEKTDIPEGLITPKKLSSKTPSPKRKVSFSDDVFESVFEAVIQRSIDATENNKPKVKKETTPAKIKKSLNDSKKSAITQVKDSKTGKSKVQTDKKEKKSGLKKIAKVVKHAVMKSPEEKAEKKKKAHLMRLQRAKEIRKTERKVSERIISEVKSEEDSASDSSEKTDEDPSDSTDQTETEMKDEDGKKIKTKKGALFRAARTHVLVESKTVVENTMPSPRWCECCQSSYYPSQPTQGAQVWRIKQLVDKDSTKSPEPIQSSSNHFIAAHASCEVRPYASPSHVSVIDSSPYVGQIVQHGHIQCSPCSCGHSGVFHHGQCQNCTLGGVSNILPCQRYSNTYSVTYPHTHGSYTHCGCGACYPAGSYHHTVGQTLIHQQQIPMTTESPILLHHPVQLQVTHDTPHSVSMATMPHSHSEPSLSHSKQSVPRPLNDQNLTHMCQLSQGEVTNVSSIGSSSPSDHEIVDVGSRDDILKNVPSSSIITQESFYSTKTDAKSKKSDTKVSVGSKKKLKGSDIVKGVINLTNKKVADKTSQKNDKKSRLLMIKQKQKQLELKSIKILQKKEAKSAVSVKETKKAVKERSKSADITKVVKKSKVKKSLSCESSAEDSAGKEQTKRAWHGWSWDGEGVMKKITNIFDGQLVQRKCYNGIKHEDGDTIQIKDCVLVCSGRKEKDIPYVAKVSNFWEDTTNGEMMMSVLWFYRPEHAEGGCTSASLENEVFAAKHRDETLVACIEDRGYVLTYNEYCRFIGEVQRTKACLPSRKKVVPDPEESYPSNRIPPVDVNPENVFLCRQVYDIKLKRVLKNPS